MVCDFPEDCRFFSEEERGMILARLKVDTADTQMNHLTWKVFFRIMKDWKIYVTGFMYLTCVTTSYSIALFLPTILTSMVSQSIGISLILGIYYGTISASIDRAVRERFHLHHDRSLSG
jgi:hypothetical protein